jgi:hypothetical protein
MHGNWSFENLEERKIILKAFLNIDAGKEYIR